MADPFTPALIAVNCAWALIQNRTDAAAVVGARRIAHALAAQKTPANHDILKATHAAFVRSIQLMAAACMRSADDARARFVAEALVRQAKDPAFTSLAAAKNIPKAELDANIRAIFDTGGGDAAVNAVATVVAGLEAALGEPLPETFRRLFRDGSDRHRSWPQAFELFFAEEVKTNERVFRALEFDRLNEILAFAGAQAGDLAAMHGELGAFREEVRDGFQSLQRGMGGLDAKVAEILDRLNRQEHDAPLALLRSLAEAFGEARPDADAAELEMYLRARIGDYHQLRARIDAVQHEDNHDAALLADANAAIAAGEFERADALLEEAEQLLDERVDRLLIRKAERRSLRGETARLNGDYEAAIGHFDAAARMLPDDAAAISFHYSWSAALAAALWGEAINPQATADAAWRWAELVARTDRATDALTWASVSNNYGSALFKLATREEGGRALATAIASFRAALEIHTREEFPEDWAMLQTNLGNALALLGERQQGTQALEEAVRHFRAALELRTVEDQPFEWARTQSNMATCLQSLGQRRAGTETLEEAVSAFRAVLKVRTREAQPYEWATTQNNLGIALSTLGERQEGTQALDQSVAAHRAALEVRTREERPIEWATSQNNLGLVLCTLATRQENNEALREGIARLRAALEVRTRWNMPHHWATTQVNLGAALSALAAHEESVDALEEAIEAFRAALELYTQETMPLQWAVTQSNLSIALATLADCQDDPAANAEAVAGYRDVLEVYTCDDMPLQRALTLENLAYTLLWRAEMLDDCATAQEAVATLEEALEILVHPDLARNRAKAERGAAKARAFRDRICGGADE